MVPIQQPAEIGANAAIIGDRAPDFTHYAARPNPMNSISNIRLTALSGLLFISAGCYVEGDAAKNLRPPATARNKPGLPKHELQPEDFSPPEWITHYREGVKLLEGKQYQPAVTAFDRSLELAPKFGLTFVNRGYAYRNLGEYEKAISDLRKGLDSNLHDGYMPLLYLADIYASCPDDKLRDGKRAVELATKGCKLTKWKHSRMLAVLAAAYAETGDYKQAIHWQTEANKYVNDELLLEMANRLQLYQDGKPCHRLMSDPWQANRD
jgi:tetratricopeptide (TPR) repeat protein